MVTRIGGKYERNLNVRVIAATNRELFKEVRLKNFRSDLYFRLNVFNINLIPLRERKEDIEMFIKFFLNKLSLNNEIKIKHIDEEFMTIVKNYRWPGNVREIENVVQRAYYMSKDGVITKELIPDYIIKNEKSTDGEYQEDEVKPGIQTVDEVEKQLIIKALRYCSGNVVNASRMINMGKSTLYRKIKKYNLEVEIR